MLMAAEGFIKIGQKDTSSDGQPPDGIDAGEVFLLDCSSFKNYFCVSQMWLIIFSISKKFEPNQFDKITRLLVFRKHDKCQFHV
jgi:hypothetical protein